MSKSPAVSVASMTSEPRTLLEQSLNQSIGQPSRAFFVPRTPKAPSASARSAIEVPNPLFGQAVIPSASIHRPVFCQCDRRAGERCAFCWAWEPSESHSIPTVWSAATSMQTSMSSTASSMWPVGQRILWLHPERVCASSGSTVVIAVKREMPQTIWGGLEVRLRHKSGEKVETLKPDGVKKGKKIAIKIPEGIAVGDYDVTVGFDSASIPGVLVLEVTNEPDSRSDTGCST